MEPEFFLSCIRILAFLTVILYASHYKPRLVKFLPSCLYFSCTLLCLWMSYYVNIWGGLGSNKFRIKRMFGTHGSWKNQNLGVCFGATSRTALPIQPILPDFLVNGPNWQCCLACSSKMATRILMFSIVLGAEYSLYVKSIPTHAPQKVDIIIHS